MRFLKQALLLILGVRYTWTNYRTSSGTFLQPCAFPP